MSGAPPSLLFSTHFALVGQRVARERKGVEFTAATWRTKPAGYMGRELVVDVVPVERYNSSFATNSGERLRTGGVRADAVALRVAVRALDGGAPVPRDVRLSVAWLMTRERPEAVLTIVLPAGEMATFHDGAALVEPAGHLARRRTSPARPSSPAQLSLFAEG